jgi:hypothetical protein
MAVITRGVLKQSKRGKEGELPSASNKTFPLPKILSLRLPLRTHSPPLASACYNTQGVCHQLSSGFELKHDRLSGDDDVKVNLWR